MISIENALEHIFGLSFSHNIFKIIYEDLVTNFTFKQKNTLDCCMGISIRENHPVIYYNMKKIRSQNFFTLLVLHEYFHWKLGHCNSTLSKTLQQSLSKKKINIAADMEVNSFVLYYINLINRMEMATDFIKSGVMPLQVNPESDQPVTIIHEEDLRNILYWLGRVKSLPQNYGEDKKEKEEKGSEGEEDPEEGNPNEGNPEEGDPEEQEKDSEEQEEEDPEEGDPNEGNPEEGDPKEKEKEKEKEGDPEEKEEDLGNEDLKEGKDSEEEPGTEDIFNGQDEICEEYTFSTVLLSKLPIVKPLTLKQFAFTIVKKYKKVPLKITHRSPPLGFSDIIFKQNWNIKRKTKINLCYFIDFSGSMSFDKFDYAVSALSQIEEVFTNIYYVICDTQILYATTQKKEALEYISRHSPCGNTYFTDIVKDLVQNKQISHFIFYTDGHIGSFYFPKELLLNEQLWLIRRINTDKSKIDLPGNIIILE